MRPYQNKSGSKRTPWNASSRARRLENKLPRRVPRKPSKQNAIRVISQTTRGTPFPLDLRNPRSAASDGENARCLPRPLTAEPFGSRPVPLTDSNLASQPSKGHHPCRLNCEGQLRGCRHLCDVLRSCPAELSASSRLRCHLNEWRDLAVIFE